MERKNKRGKTIGPYSVCVYFLDGTSLMVREQIADEECWQAFNEYSRGIGAMVGTTRRVVVTDEADNEVCCWEYKSGDSE